MLIRVLFIWNPILCAIFSLLFGGTENFVPNFTVSIIIGTCCALTAITSSMLIGKTIAWLMKRRGLEAPERGPVWGMVVSVVGMPPGLWIGFRIAQWGYDIPDPGIRNYATSIGIGVVILMALIIHETTFDLRDARRRAVLKEQEAENERLRRRVAALTAQMNPHFLFNSLNTIASLTRSDADAAEEMTVELADLYRGVLDATRRAMYPLADELQICRAYLRIEQARFGDRLRWSIEIDPDVDPQFVRVPPLIVQPLIENAVKHGLSPRAQGGEVGVRVAASGAGVEILVVDDGVGFAAESADGSGTALRNIEQRLSLLGDVECGIEVDGRAGQGTTVRLSLPRLSESEAAFSREEPERAGTAG